MPGDYAALGLSSSASLDDVKSAYRQLVKIYHPDRNPTDPEAAVKFTRITEAYDWITKGQQEMDAVGADDRVDEIPIEVIKINAVTMFEGDIFTILPHGVLIIPPMSYNGIVVRFHSLNGKKVDFKLIYDTIPNFIIQDDDLITILKVPHRALIDHKFVHVLGHPNSRERVQFPPGTKDGDKIKFVGRGLPTQKGGRGNLHVVVDLQKPTHADNLKKLFKSLVWLIIIIGVVRMLLP